MKPFYKTQPYEHQRNELKRMWDWDYFAHFWEMGLGKSKVVIDNAAALFLKGKINGLMIVAPKGVYLNWFYNEIPIHMSDDVRTEVGYWSAKMNKTRTGKADKLARGPVDGVLDIICINTESFSSKRGPNYAAKFLATHDTMMVVDESTDIKTPKALRTKATVKLGRLAKYRRILTGSPVTQSPLDLYSQCNFLKEGALEFTSYTAFKAYFCDIIKRHIGNRSFQEVVGYKNIDELKSRISKIGSRLLKEDCLDLPDKNFSTVYVELSPEQKKAYEELRDIAVTELEGGLITATHALTTLIKLHQIICGHCKDEDGHTIDIPNDRVNTLMDVVAGSGGKIIIWCKFIRDVQLVEEALTNEYGDESCVSFYGATSDDSRVKGVRRFQTDDTCRFFVATSAASKGLTLTACNLNIYYSHSFSLEDFLQSQDRTHRIGQTNNVTYVSLAVRDTIDEKIMRSLVAKKNLADNILNTWQDLI